MAEAWGVECLATMGAHPHRSVRVLLSVTIAAAAAVHTGGDGSTCCGSSRGLLGGSGSSSIISVVVTEVLEKCASETALST